VHYSQADHVFRPPQHADRWGSDAESEIFNLQMLGQVTEFVMFIMLRSHHPVVMCMQEVLVG
jgi:hypothetical protein